jgi:[ribosomal protein S18]-alanine N-acetyltransferase
MREEDVPEVSRVERRCFSNPWPSSAYRRELADAQHNVYVVLREVRDDPVAAAGDEPPRRHLPLGPFRHLVRHLEGDGRIVGFAGMWHMFEEAHVTTIGVDGNWRGRGLGELLLLTLIDQAVARGAHWLTLEVRISNEPAQSLYRKYGFSVQGTRRRYYSDNDEDAYIMWSPDLTDPATHELIERGRTGLAARHPGVRPAVARGTDAAAAAGAPAASPAGAVTADAAGSGGA